jgi:O-antigen/teichoic acid export membrane protein
MSEARGLGRDTLWYGLGNLVAALLGVAQIALFTHLLRPAEFGVFYLVLSAANIVNSIGYAWINQTVKRYYPGYDAQARAELLGRVLAAYLLTIASLLLLAVVASLILPLFGYSGLLPWPSVLLSVGTGAVTYVQWLYTIQRKPRGFTVNQLIYNVGKLGLGYLFLVHIRASGTTLAFSASLAGLAAAAFGAWQLREPVAVTRESFQAQTLRSFATYGMPLALVNGGGWLLNTAGRVMLGILADTAAVGVYGAAQQLAQQIVTLAVQPIVTAADPLTIRLHASEGRAATAKFLSVVLGLIILLGSGICLTLSLLAFPMGEVMLNREYLDGARLFAILAPATLFWLLTPVLVKSQEIGEKLGELPWLMVGAGLLNIALNFLLIPHYGALGAALSMLVANALLGVAAYLRGQQHLSWALPLRLLSLSAFALLVTAGLHAVLPQPRGFIQVAVAFVGYMVAYLGVCAGSMALARRTFSTELDFLRQMARRRTNPGSPTAPSGDGPGE